MLQQKLAPETIIEIDDDLNDHAIDVDTFFKSQASNIITDYLGPQAYAPELKFEFKVEDLMQEFNQ